MAVTAKPIATRQYGDLQVLIFDNGADLGVWAAANLAQTIAVSITARSYASIIVATGNSQLQLMRALRERNHIQWNQVYVFHIGSLYKHGKNVR